MDPAGGQGRISSGKRRKEVLLGEDDIARDNQKIPRRWVMGRTDEVDAKDTMPHSLEYQQALSMDHWMRLQQQKVDPLAPTTPVNLQHRAIPVVSLHDMRSIDSSKQSMLSCQQSQQLVGPQQHNQQSQQLVGPQQHNQQSIQQVCNGTQQATQPVRSSQQSIQQGRLTQQSSQQLCNGQILRFHQLDADQMHMHLPYMDVAGTSRSPSALPSLPLSFKPPPIFAESDLRHSPTSSSSNAYPLQTVGSQSLPQGGLLSDHDDDRFGCVVNQGGCQQQTPNGLPGASSALGLEDLQASSSWYMSMRELEAQPSSSSRVSRPISQCLQESLSNGQGDILYSTQALNDMTNHGLAALPFQSCGYGEGRADQEPLLPDPQSSLQYGVSGGLPSVGSKCSSSSLARLNKPILQGRRLISGSHCPPSIRADVLLNSNMMANGGLSDDPCFMQFSVPPPKPVRTYTKVYKLGCIGRALDVTRFSNYTELRFELARMFGLEGQLDGWQLVFQDNENDILLVGDDPWEEFVASVRGIRILSPSEVNFFYMNEERFGTAYSNLTSTSGVTKQYK